MPIPPTGTARIAATVLLPLFTLLFVQLPLSGGFPGHVDTWLAVALSNNYLASIKAALTGAPGPIVLFPVGSPFSFGESAPGFATLFILFKLLGLDDVWAYYAFITIVYTLAGTGVALLASLYLPPVSAVFAGLCFAASNFTLANIDDPIVVAFFPATVCLFFVKRFLTTGRSRDLAWATVLGAAQAYCSAYVFLFQTAAIAVLAAVNFRSLRGHGRALALAVSGYVLMVAPFFMLYLVVFSRPEIFNPWNSTAIADIHSLEFSDLTRVLPGNLLYESDPLRREGGLYPTERVTGAAMAAALSPSEIKTVCGRVGEPDEVPWYVDTRRRAFIGWSTWLLAIVGVLVSRDAGRRELLAIAAVGLCVALGPTVSLFGHLYPSLLYPAYRLSEMTGFLRVPSRGFLLSLIAIAILAGHGLTRIRALAGRVAGSVPSAALVAMVLLENVPSPMPTWAAAPYAKPSGAQRDYFEKHPDAVVLNLPAAMGASLMGHGPIIEYNREAIYMNWASYHGRSTVNGVNGYFTHTRTRLQRALDAQTGPGRDLCTALSWATFVAEFGVTHVVFNLNMVIDASELPLLDALQHCDLFREEVQSGESVIFALDQSEIRRRLPFLAKEPAR